MSALPHRGQRIRSDGFMSLPSLTWCKPRPSGHRFRGKRGTHAQILGPMPPALERTRSGDTSPLNHAGNQLSAWFVLQRFPALPAPIPVRRAFTHHLTLLCGVKRSTSRAFICGDRLARWAPEILHTVEAIVHLFGLVGLRVVAPVLGVTGVGA
jgi:hypothetical protein